MQASQPARRSGRSSELEIIRHLLLRNHDQIHRYTAGPAGAPPGSRHVLYIYAVAEAESPKKIARATFNETKSKMKRTSIHTTAIT
jgi:hypothetical protein